VRGAAPRLLLLDPDADLWSILIAEVQQASDVLCGAAYKRHLAARGNTQHVRLDPADGDTHERLARQARSWGVELSA